MVTDKYIIYIPIQNNLAHGVVSAYHNGTGLLAWSITYTNNEVDGICKVYGNRKDVSIFKCINPNVSLHKTAVKCAEYVLA